GEHGTAASGWGVELGADNALDLALAEALGMLREPLGEGVAHERGRGGPAGLEAHPEADEGAPHEGPVVSRQDLPRVEDHAEIHPRPRALERQALLHGQQDLADAEQPDDGHDEVEALHEIREAEIG